jgi:hypothetical protein
VDIEGLEAQLDAFERLPVGHDGRKAAVDRWEAAILAGEIQVETPRLLAYETDERGAARVLAYLVYQHEPNVADMAVLRRGVEREWDRLRRRSLVPGVSTMPLYYALRMYVARLKQAPGLVSNAAQDAALFSTIAQGLPRPLDRSGHIDGKLQELATLFEARRPPPHDAAVAAAEIAKSGVVEAARTAKEAALEAERVKAETALRAERVKSTTAITVAALGIAGALAVGLVKFDGSGATRPTASVSASKVGGKPTANDTCQAVLEGGFNSDASHGVEYDTARWVFGDAQRSLGRLVRGARDAENPSDLGRKSIMLERVPALESGVERFAEPDRTDFTRIEWAVPQEWHHKGVRLNATLRWEGVRPFAAAGRTATVAVNFKADVPAGYGLRETRVAPAAQQSNTPPKVENVYAVLIAEATPDSPWVRYTFPVYRPPAHAGTVTLRIGLHAVYGRLYIDDVSFDLCE